MSPDTRAKFGKHKGKTVSWIQKNDWRYFEWAKANAPGMFQDSPSFGSKQPDRSWGKPSNSPSSVSKNLGESSWMQIPSIPHTMKEEPPERDDSDPNSSSFMYNIAKRMLDNGEL